MSEDIETYCCSVTKTRDLYIHLAPQGFWKIIINFLNLHKISSLIIHLHNISFLSKDGGLDYQGGDGYYDDISLPHVSPIDHHYGDGNYGDGYHYGDHYNPNNEVLTSSQYHENHIPYRDHEYSSESMPDMIHRLTTTRRCEGTDCKNDVAKKPSLPTKQNGRLNLITDHTQDPKVMNHIVKLANQEAAVSETLINQGKERDTDDSSNYLGSHVLESINLGAQIKKKNDSLKHLQEIVNPTNQEVERVNGQNELTNHLQEANKLKKGQKMSPSSPNVIEIVPHKTKGPVPARKKPFKSKQTDGKLDKPVDKTEEESKKPRPKKTQKKKMKNKEKNIESALGKEAKSDDDKKKMKTSKKKPKVSVKKINELPSTDTIKTGKSGKNIPLKSKTKFDQQSTEQQQDSSEEIQPQDSKETKPPLLNNKAKKPAGIDKNNLVKKLRNATLSQIKYFKAMTSLLLHRINKNADRQQKVVEADANVAEQPPQIQQQNTIDQTTKQYPVQIDSVNCGKKSNCTSSETSNVEKQSGEFVKTNENILPVFFKPKMVAQKRKITQMKGLNFVLNLNT